MTNLIMGKILNYILSYSFLPLFLMGLLGLILGWLIWGRMSRGHEGDLSLEGEGALRAEADDLRARVRELEGQVGGGVSVEGDPLDDSAALRAQIRDLESKLEAGGGSGIVDADDDETYALEWRNRYLAARVKYLEGRLADAPVAKAKATKKAPVKKAPAKKAPAKKAAAKKAAPPKVLYTDGPTDGTPDDLKKIKGIGPKFEKDLNGKGIYYFRQIGNWKKKDVTMVEGVIDSIPGRIERDEWVKQAKGLAKSAAVSTTARKKPGPKPGTKRGATNLDGTPRKKPGPKPSGAKKAASGNDKYYENVQKFHKAAKRGTVDNIVKYCGIALRSRDSSLVACSDPSELETVNKNFAQKKLGLDKEAGAKLVQDVCQEMKGERFKNRVTFYYLCARKAKKLDIFA